MASLLPLIQDLLPMIMPSSVHIAKAEDLAAVPGPRTTPKLSAGGAQAEDAQAADGVIQKDAIVHKTDKMCAGVMVAKPRSSSTVRHHGEQDTIIYAVSGPAVLATHTGDEEAGPKRHELSAGDFAMVPCWTEYQMINETDGEISWVLIRSGPGPVQVDLTEWGGPEIKRKK